MINGYFKFHSVGQGLFYEGNIKLDDGTFRFVYDCGEQHGRGGLPKALHEYNLRNHDEYIDLLVLSHLDFDHFSGIPDLLNNHKVKMLVMPYYNLYDLFLLGEQVLNSALSDGEKHRILNFCSDPEGFLREHVLKVILMAGEREETDGLEDAGVNEGLNWGSQTFSDFKVLATNSKSFLLRVAKWEFIFHNRYADPADIKSYRDSLIKAVGGKDLLKNVMSDINEFKKFAKTIKKSMPQKKSNNNSVILYHGPNINLPQHFIKECAGYYSYYYPFNNITVDGFGTLLTGDIEDIENEWNHIINSLTRQRVANIGNFLVPHHGAKTNFTNFEFENCIISYGIRNTYRHPHPSTLHTIANSCTHLHLVNEYNSYSYRIIEIKLLRN